VFFLLDQDVDAEVGRMLRRYDHQCVTAGQVGLAEAQDDDLTVWADRHGAVLISSDREFSQRRQANSVGRHIWLRCPDWDAAEVLESRLGEVLRAVQALDHVVIRISKDRVDLRSSWT
jgi:predicted nuclease of predicted toxin-antitoxin system